MICILLIFFFLKAIRIPSGFDILISKYILDYKNYFFDILISKNTPTMGYFINFDFEICFGP